MSYIFYFYKLFYKFEKYFLIYINKVKLERNEYLKCKI